MMNGSYADSVIRKTALTMIPSFVYILIERFILRGNTAVMGAR